MDIVIDKKLPYAELKRFLEAQFPHLDFFLLYETVNDWDDAPPNTAIFQYVASAAINQGFQYGLSVHLKNEEILAVIERLSAALSCHFDCRVACDASRVVLKERNVYYSLLFEKGKVFLVDDVMYEDTGEFAKIVELRYDCPEYHFD